MDYGAFALGCSRNTTRNDADSQLFRRFVLIQPQPPASTLALASFGLSMYEFVPTSIICDTVVYGSINPTIEPSLIEHASTSFADHAGACSCGRVSNSKVLENFLEMLDIASCSSPHYQGKSAVSYQVLLSE